MNYLDFKKTEELVIKSKNAYGYAMMAVELYPIVSKRIEDYKYRYRDLDDIQMKLLYKLNNLLDGDIISGDKILRTVCNIQNKTMHIVETDTVDVFKIFNDIQNIKEVEQYNNEYEKI